MSLEQRKAKVLRYAKVAFKKKSEQRTHNNLVAAARVGFDFHQKLYDQAIQSNLNERYLQDCYGKGYGTKLWLSLTGDGGVELTISMIAEICYAMHKRPLLRTFYSKGPACS